jgi:hypothetical protein
MKWAANRAAPRVIVPVIVVVLLSVAPGVRAHAQVNRVQNGHQPGDEHGQGGESVPVARSV